MFQSGFTFTVNWLMRTSVLFQHNKSERMGTSVTEVSLPRPQIRPVNISTARWCVSVHLCEATACTIHQVRRPNIQATDG